jgi:hypothetical protein
LTYIRILKNIFRALGTHRFVTWLGKICGIIRVQELLSDTPYPLIFDQKARNGIYFNRFMTKEMSSIKNIRCGRWNIEAENLVISKLYSIFAQK